MLGVVLGVAVVFVFAFVVVFVFVVADVVAVPEPLVAFVERLMIAAAKIRIARLAAARAGITLEEFQRRCELEQARIDAHRLARWDVRYQRAVLEGFARARGNRMAWFRVVTADEQAELALVP